MDASGDNSGCLYQTLLFVLTFFFGAGMFAGAPVDVTPPPSTITVAPSDEGLPFDLQNNLMMLQHRSTLDRPCEYALEGYVFDLQGDPLAGFAVHIQTTDAVAGEPKQAGVYSDGFWSYAGFLKWEDPVEVWMTLEDSAERISPIVTIPSIGCDYNLVIINFVQVRPLSPDND